MRPLAETNAAVQMSFPSSQCVSAGCIHQAQQEAEPVWEEEPSRVGGASLQDAEFLTLR